MKLTKISLFLSSALLLVACDDSHSGSSTKAAKASSTTSSKTNSQKSVTASAKKEKATPAVATPAAPAAPAAPQMVEAMIIAANPAIITNLDSDPFAGMNDITSDTINNHSSYYSYVCEGREYNLARVRLPATEELKSAKYWVVMVRHGNDFLVANEDQFNTLVDTLAKDESSDAKRFASQLKNNEVRAFDADAFNDINSRAAVKTWVAAPTDNSVTTEVYNKARLSFPSGETFEMSTSPASGFVSANGNEYTVVAIKTDTIVKGGPFGWSSYNKKVYAPAKIVKNLFRFEYAPLTTAESDALISELNAAANAETKDRNATDAQNFLKALEMRKADLNDSEIRNPAYTVVKKITAPAPTAVVEVTSQN